MVFVFTYNPYQFKYQRDKITRRFSVIGLKAKKLNWKHNKNNDKNSNGNKCYVLKKKHFNQTVKLKPCNYCGSSLSYKICKGCQQVRYCNKICQKRDWVLSHKYECVKL